MTPHPSIDGPLRLVAGALRRPPVVKRHKAVVDALLPLLPREVDVHNIAPAAKVDFDLLLCHVVRNASHIQTRAFAVLLHLLAQWWGWADMLTILTFLQIGRSRFQPVTVDTSWKSGLRRLGSWDHRSKLR